MPEVEGVQMVPARVVARAAHLLVVQELAETKQALDAALRRLARVRSVAKELETIAPHAAVLVKGALER